MKSDKESLSFGQYLQSVRLAKKISLEQVSDETRIGLGTLRLIEREEHENLPAKVFVKGFLRAYARAIGADGDEAVQRYESRLSVIKELSDTDKDYGTSTLRSWWNLFFVMVVYVALIAVSILGMSYFERHSSEGDAFKQHAAAHKQQVAPTPAQGDIESDKSAVKTVEEKFVLHINAKEDTWMKVIIDNRDPKEYDLASGDSLELEASSKFNLLIGNAGGVTLKLNNKEIPVAGKNGEMVNIDLP